MKVIYCLMVMLWPFVSKGQTDRAINIGDTVPNIIFKQVLNYPTHSGVSISEFKNKMVVFDFMTTGCMACLSLLPHFDSLQKKFGDQIQFFLVTPETEKRVRFFLQKENIRKLNLPVIIEDTLLEKLFPHTFISHEVVINKGIVTAITYPEYLTSANIESIINGKRINLLVKKDVTTFEYGKPLLVLNKVIPDFSYPASKMYSIVTSCMNNVSRRFSISYDTSLNQVRISMINLSILDLYEHALFGAEIRPAFIKLNVADTGRYVYQKQKTFLHDWRLRNSYSYEGAFPMNFTEDQIKSKIVNDLDLFLSMEGRVETNIISCWVISNDSSVEAYNYSKSAISGSNTIPRPVSINSITFYLNGKFGTVPVFDETGKGDLKIKGLEQKDYTNIPVLAAKLSQYQMKITRQNRQVRMLVITENNQK